MWPVTRLDPIFSLIVNFFIKESTVLPVFCDLSPGQKFQMEPYRFMLACALTYGEGHLQLRIT